MSYQLESFVLSFLAAGGGAVAISFALFRFLGQSLLERWFERKKEEYRQEHAREIEYMRVKLDSILRAVLTIQEREYAIIPEAWALMTRALNAASAQTAFIIDDSPFYSGEKRKDTWDDELEEFIARQAFTSAEKAAISSAPDMFETYAKAHHKMRTREARKAHMTLRDYILAQSIFLPEDLKSGFGMLSDQIHDLVIDTEGSGPSPEMNDRYYQIRKQAFEFSRTLYDRLTRPGQTLNKLGIDEGEQQERP